GAADDLAVGEGEPAVVGGGPRLPALVDPLEFLAGGVTALDGVLGDRRRDHASAPRLAPPLALLRGGEAPGRGGRGDVGEPGGAGPGDQAAARVGLSAVAAGDGVVDRHPGRHLGRLRIPDDGAEVDVAGRDDAAGAGDAAHLAEGADRVGDVLEDLVGVDDVERAVGEVQGVDVGDGELDVVQARGVRAGL